MICVGTLIMSSAIIPLTMDDQFFNQRACDAACMSTPWLVIQGFGISFSALLSKTLRINRILNNAKKFQRVKVSVRDVMAPFLILSGSNFIVLICVTLIRPLKYVRTFTNQDMF